MIKPGRTGSRTDLGSVLLLPPLIYCLSHVLKCLLRDCFSSWWEDEDWDTLLRVQRWTQVGHPFIHPSICPSILYCSSRDAGMFRLNSFVLGRGGTSWVLMVYYEDHFCDGTSANAVSAPWGILPTNHRLQKDHFEHGRCNHRHRR